MAGAEFPPVGTGRNPLGHMVISLNTDGMAKARDQIPPTSIPRRPVSAAGGRWPRSPPSGTNYPRLSGETCPAWFSRVNIAGAAATGGDIFILQDESNTTNLSQYDSRQITLAPRRAVR